MSFIQHYEHLVNALSNGDIDIAANSAEYLVSVYKDDPEMFTQHVNIENLKIGFTLNSARLHVALCTIVAFTLSTVDLDVIIDKYSLMIREYCKSSALRPLFPLLIEQLKVTPMELVQSELFPYMVIGLTDQEISGDERMEGALRGLVLEDPDSVHLIDKTLQILVPSNDTSSSVFARILSLRLGLIIVSENAQLLSNLWREKIQTKMDDILLIANCLEVVAECTKTQEVVCLLRETGVIQSVIDICFAKDSLCDFALSVLLKSASVDLDFIEEIKGHFENELRDVYTSHPIAIQILALIYLKDGSHADALHVFAVHETGPRQLNALKGIQHILADHHEERQKHFFNNVFPGIFTFIAEQIPLKGDQESRSSFYDLLYALLFSKKEWLLEKAFGTPKFVTFLFDRSADRSPFGLQKKFELMGRLVKEQNIPTNVKNRADAYLAEGEYGRPSVQVASNYGH